MLAPAKVEKLPGFSHINGQSQSTKSWTTSGQHETLADSQILMIHRNSRCRFGTWTECQNTEVAGEWRKNAALKHGPGQGMSRFKGGTWEAVVHQGGVGDWKLSLHQRFMTMTRGRSLRKRWAGNAGRFRIYRMYLAHQNRFLSHLPQTEMKERSFLRIYRQYRHPVFSSRSTQYVPPRMNSVSEVVQRKEAA